MNKPTGEAETRRTPRVSMVTGLSGAGKSVALHTLEDEGFFCIDNLPAALLPDVIDRLIDDQGPHYERLAIGIDMRSERGSDNALLSLMKNLRKRTDADVEMLFLCADRSTLVTRFSETRRKHPLSSKTRTLINAIDDEERALDAVKAGADLVIDTTQLNLHELRDIIRTYVLGRTASGLSLIFQSFGFKHGTPASTDFTFDVRCLPNPYWKPELRAFNGREQPIIDYLGSEPDVQDMYTYIRDFLSRWLPLFEAENRAYLTVSIGCTGGRHRSVYLSERLAAHFRQQRESISLRHRELGVTVTLDTDSTTPDAPAPDPVDQPVEPS